MILELTPFQARYLRDCIAARQVLMREAMLDSTYFDERLELAALTDIGIDLAFDLELLIKNGS